MKGQRMESKLDAIQDRLDELAEAKPGRAKENAGNDGGRDDAEER
jgi:hypothetical protein